MPTTGMQRGTDNFKAVLTEEDVREIYKSNEKQGKLAKRFGVSQSTISHIKHKHTWRWLTDKIDRESS